jgi:hypothetical protein
MMARIGSCQEPAPATHQSQHLEQLGTVMEHDADKLDRRWYAIDGPVVAWSQSVSGLHTLPLRKSSIRPAAVQP